MDFLLQFGQAIMAPLVFWFLFTDAMNEGTAIVLQAASDAVAMVSLVARGTIVLRNKKDASFCHNQNKMIRTLIDARYNTNS